MQIIATDGIYTLEDNDLGSGDAAMLAIDTNGTDVRITKTDSEFMAKFVIDAEVQLYYNGSKKFETTSTGVSVTGSATITGTNTFLIESNSTAATFNLNSTVRGFDFINNNATLLSIDNDGNGTFADQAFATTATSSGDGSSTLTTKGYVDGLITGATIYRGAWDPSGGGYGSPDLSGVTQTSGYYYICSADGTAEPNGTGTEPDTWAVGDWVIYNDVSGTGQWQKIDNSSVLSGVGTGQTVALWEGAGSVTDSETLGNAPITVSGNNTTFAGNVALTGDLKVTADAATADIVAQWADSNGNNTATFRTTTPGQIFEIRSQNSGTLKFDSTSSTFTGDLNLSAGKKLQYNANSFITPENNTSGAEISTAGTFIVKTGTTPTLGLTLDASQNATFAGRVTAVGFTSTSSNVYTGGMSSFETTLTDNEDWQNSPISIIERGGVGSTQTSDKYAPNLNFHWAGRASKSLWLGATGQLNFGEYSATGIPASDGRINAATFYGDHLGTINTATTGVTQTAGDNSTKIATTAYADAAAGAVPIGNYLPLAGGTMTGAINAGGGLYYVGDSNMGFVPYPIGAQFRSDSNALTGYIKIELPTDIGTNPDDMVSFYVDVYDYTTNEMISLFIGGYTYTSGGAASSYWYNCTAIINTKQTGKDFDVKFGFDGAHFYVAIGETTSVWSHPSIVVRDVQCSYRSNVVHYIDGWDVSVTTTALVGVDETQTGNFPQAKHAITATSSVTQVAGDNSTLIATTAYADSAAAAVPIGNYLPLAAMDQVIL